MKTIFHFILISSIWFLAGCSNDEKETPKTTSNKSTYAKPTNEQSDGSEVEVRELTDEIRRALKINDGGDNTQSAAFVIVPTFDGKLVVFENKEQTKNISFPIETSAILDIKPIAITSYKGSTCRTVHIGGYQQVICR